MKKIFFLLTLVSLSLNLYSQSNTFEFLLDTNNDMFVYDGLIYNGTYYYVGYSRDSRYNIENSKGFIFKLDKSGNLIDSTSYSLQKMNFITNILPDSNNKLLLTGYCTMDTLTIYAYNSSIFLYLIDTNFNILKSNVKKFPDTLSFTNLVTRRDLNNDILNTGSLWEYSPNIISNMFVYKFDKNLDSVMFKIPANLYIPRDIRQLNDTIYWILTDVEGCYLKLDSNFNIIDYHNKTPHFVNGTYGIKWDTDTSFFLAGDYINDKNNKLSDHDIGIIRQYHPFDTTNNIFNYTGFIDTLDHPAYYGALDYVNKDTIYVGGTKDLLYGNINYGTIPSWFFIIQTDSNLQIRWERFYGGDAYYAMTKIMATDDGGCIAVGTRYDYLNNNKEERDIYIIKLNNQGLITSSNGKPSPLVHNAIVYPNPGKNTIRVRVAVQYKHSVFRLFDINGKLVVSQNITGKSAIINTSFLPSGTYIYKITGKNGLYESGKWIKKGD